MNLNNAIKFIYLGIAAWIYSIIVQTPAAYFIWDMTLDQYIKWAITGLPVTLLFFGELIRIYLNKCNSLFDRVLGSDNNSEELPLLICPNCGFTTKSVFAFSEHVDMDETGNCEDIHY